MLMEYKSNRYLYKRLKTISIVVSLLVCVLVVFMRSTKINLGVDFSFLPPLHALFNTIVTICLLCAFYFITNKNVNMHKNFIYGAMFFSGLFLISYVLFHFITDDINYCHVGWSRIVYFILLISHIVFAAISLPFILITFSRGYTYLVEEHRKMARWVFPLWLYVAITGPLCYVMLKSCYL